MSVTGQCQVCGTRPAAHRCASCGSLVCEEHFEVGAGVCADCAGPGAGRRL